MVTYLQNNFTHAKNGEEGNLSFEGLGDVVRKTITRNGCYAPGDGVRGEGTVSEKYFDACRVILELEDLPGTSQEATVSPKSACKDA